MLKLSNRSLIPPFIVMDVLRAANEYKASGSDVIHMEVGQPSSSAPSKVKEMAHFAIDNEDIGYTDALGNMALRNNIASYYKNCYDVSVDPSRIVVTTGASGGLILAFLASFDSGDKVGLASPGYPAYKNILQTLGIKVVEIPVNSKTGYRITTQLLAKIPTPIDGLIIASPSNPTGSMISSSEMSKVVRWCVGEGVRLISDEIYHGIVYEKQAATAAKFSGDVIVVNSFSKYFSMTGWRLGWMVCPNNLVRPIERLAQNSFISPPTLSQIAATAAFDCLDELDLNVERYRVNREVLLEGLPKLGFTSFAPADGAFYIYADVSHISDNSKEFCENMLSETGIAATPGIDFDQTNGGSFVRFCFAGATQEIEEAVKRLKNWLN